MANNPYEKSKSSPIQDASSWLKIAAILAFFVNSIVAFLLFTFIVSGSTIAGLGYSFIQALIIPALVLGFFQLFEGFRNTRSRIKIFLITSIVLIVLVLIMVAIFVLSF